MSNIKNLDFNQFYMRTSLSGHEHLYVRPGITLTFFLDESLIVSCKAVADLIDLFLASIQPGTLRSFLAKNGYYKPLTNQQITKDLKKLRNLPADYEGFTLSYSEGELGQVGAYAFVFIAEESDPISPKRSNLVRLEFPEDVLESWGETRFLQFITDAAECLPFFSGHAGLAFKRIALGASESESIRAIAPLLPRYLGFDPSEHWFRWWMRGHTYTGHWINLLGTQLTEILGGVETIKTNAKQAEFKKLRNGTWLRSARFPPVGDVNRGANDIGQLPTVARLLRPARCPSLRFAHTEFDAMAWLARFDELSSKEWDNS